ncbi:MAG: hypothetical protein PHQ80_03800 [Candidatus ainarchaeum sp.]|nr:hypothetical protein [Candidatus ainarchaeum sp.]
MKKMMALLLFGILLFGCTLPSLPETGTGATGPGTPHPATEGSPAEQPPATVAPEVPAQEPPPQTANKQELVRWFVMNRLMDSEGAVRYSYNSTSYSSQSVWMVMDYALDTWDEGLFQKEYAFFSGKFVDGDCGLAYAALDSQKAPEQKNNLYYSATGDNLRIAKALFAAHDRWGGTEYSDAAQGLGRSMLSHSVFGNILVKESYWSGSGSSPATRMRSADADWSVLERLKLEGQGWNAVATATRSRTLGCTESGFFWPEFNVANPSCDYGSGNSMARTVDSLQSAIAFADMNALEPAVITFTKISNEYNQLHIISNGYTIPLNGIGNRQEDPGTYATMGLLAVKLNRCEFAAKMRDRVLDYFVGDATSPLYGSISQGGDAYAYDNLEALIFLEEYGKVC